MNSNRDGEYKLLFSLPLYQDAAEVLFLDFQSEGLGNRLASLGIEVRAGSMARPAAIPEPAAGAYDLIITGRLPAGREEAGALSGAADMLRPGSGHLVAVVENRFWFRRISGLLPGRKAPGAGPARTASLGAVRRALRGAGFTGIEAFSPVPDSSNPSVVISLAGSGPLEFLVSWFPDFMRSRSGLIDSLQGFLVRAGLYRYLLREYIVVAGNRRK